jgi:hypothetical protein
MSSGRGSLPDLPALPTGLEGQQAALGAESLPCLVDRDPAQGRAPPRLEEVLRWDRDQFPVRGRAAYGGRVTIVLCMTRYHDVFDRKHRQLPGSTRSGVVLDGQ